MFHGDFSLCRGSIHIIFMQVMRPALKLSFTFLKIDVFFYTSEVCERSQLIDIVRIMESVCFSILSLPLTYLPCQPVLAGQTKCMAEGWS